MKIKLSSLKVCFLLTCLKLAQLFMLGAAVFVVCFCMSLFLHLSILPMTLYCCHWPRLIKKLQSNLEQVLHSNLLNPTTNMLIAWLTSSVYLWSPFMLIYWYRYNTAVGLFLAFLSLISCWRCYEMVCKFSFLSTVDVFYIGNKNVVKGLFFFSQ